MALYRKFFLILLGCFYFFISLLIWRSTNFWGFRFILMYLGVLFIVFNQGERFTQHIFQFQKQNYAKKYLFISLFEGKFPSIIFGDRREDKAGEAEKWLTTSIGPGVITVDQDHALLVEELDQHTFRVCTNGSFPITRSERFSEIVSLKDQFLKFDVIVYTKERIPLIIRGIIIHYRLDMSDNESKAIRAKNVALPITVEEAVSRNIYNRPIVDGAIASWSNTIQEIVAKAFRETVNELPVEQVLFPGKDDDIRGIILHRLSKDLDNQVKQIGTRITWLNFNNIDVQLRDGMKSPTSPWFIKAKIKETEEAVIVSERMLLANDKLVDAFRARTLAHFSDACSRFDLSKDPFDEILHAFSEGIPSDNL